MNERYTKRTCAMCGLSEIYLAYPLPPWRKAYPCVWYCHRCGYRENPHYKRIKDLDMTTPELIQAAEDACRMSMRNTAMGAWLAVALEYLAAEHQNACGKEH